MFIKHFSIKCKNPNTATASYNGRFDILNMKFYDENGSLLTVADAKNVSKDLGTFTLGGVNAEVKCNRGYNTTYSALRAVSSGSYYCMCLDNSVLDWDEQGVFVEFEKPIDLSKITFSSGKGVFCSGWCVYLNDAKFAIMEDKTTKTNAAETVTVDLFLDTFQKKGENIIYYVQGGGRSFRSIELKPAVLGTSTSGSFSIMNLQLWDENKQFKLALVESTTDYATFTVDGDADNIIKVTSLVPYATANYWPAKIIANSGSYYAFQGNLNGFPIGAYGFKIDFTKPFSITNIKWSNYAAGAANLKGSDWTVKFNNKDDLTVKGVNFDPSISGEFYNVDVTNIGVSDDNKN